MALSALIVVLALLGSAAGALPSQCQCPPATPRDAVCGSDGVTYDSKCALGCAAGQRGLTVAHQGLCKLAGTRSVIEIEDCIDDTYTAGVVCQNRCAASSCVDNCVLQYAIEGTCACRKYLTTFVGSLLPYFTTTSKHNVSMLMKPSNTEIVPFGIADDGIRCYNTVAGILNTCVARCSDEACQLKCYDTALQSICDCNPNPATAAPTQAPTNAPTQRPTNAPTQAPSNAPTQGTVIPSTTPSDGGISLKSQTAIIAMSSMVVYFVR